MRIRVESAELLPGLLRFLAERVDLITFPASETEVDVSVLGSFADGGRAELLSLLERWRLANPTATVELVPAAPERSPADDDFPTDIGLHPVSWSAIGPQRTSSTHSPWCRYALRLTPSLTKPARSAWRLARSLNP